MIREKIKIGLALKNGYRFVGVNWRYLATVSVVPLLLNIICNLFVLLQRPEASVIEIYLWQLPAIASFGWLLFLQTRLLFFMEKLGDPQISPIFAAERRQAKQASIIIFILFNMFFKMSTMALVAFVGSDFIQNYPALGFLPIVILAGLFWCVRYGVLHIVAAISFPLSIFIRRVKSPLFSIQLILLALGAIIPMIFLFQIVITSFMPEILVASADVELSVFEKIKLVLMTAPINILVLLLTNACVCYAVKYMLYFGSSKEQL